MAFEIYFILFKIICYISLFQTIGGYFKKGLTKKIFSGKLNRFSDKSEYLEKKVC